MDPERDFVLLVDKRAGPTSHDVVRVARRALSEKRIGHAGTLDPFATGLLVLCVGRATRLAQWLTPMPKCYDAVARLGVTTDTHDLDGEVVAESDGWRELELADVERAAESFVGEIDQVPPKYSAKKVGGEAAHRRARRGEEVALEASRVTIHELEIEPSDLPELHFRVRCSKGTYIRSIARDLGEALGVGAHLTGLRRTSIGPFSVSDAVTTEALERGDVPDSARLDPLVALGQFERVDLDGPSAARIGHGGPVDWPDVDDASMYALAHEGRLLAVAEGRAGTLKPLRVFQS